jgi:1-phosphatidylinositol-3-phosphate 5-kinase
MVAFRRKHHCRICGRIFDDKCTSYIPGSRFGHQEKIRVCNSCKNIMDEYDDLEAQGNSITFISKADV